MPFLRRRAVAPRVLHRVVTPTGKARELAPDDIIVSKTDLKGRITYANDIFLAISGFAERELLGAPHSIIRHPDMPRAVFRLLWDRVQAGQEVFAYVINLSRNGDHYWVLAHVTPSFDDAARIVGYHSMRRRPNPEAIDQIRPLYAELRRAEAGGHGRKAGVAAADSVLRSFLQRRGLTYDELVFALDGAA